MHTEDAYSLFGTVAMSYSPSSSRPAVRALSRPTRVTATGQASLTSDQREVDLAVRLLSEAAHDLKSPLTTIRESIRLVREGDMGEINDEQILLLSAAMDEAERMSQLVGDMTQMDRLRTGVPRVQRQWVTVETIRGSVDATLRPWSVPRNMNVLWDGADVPISVFADLTMIQRLIVNLVGNAIRASDEGGTVLIKLEPQRGGETLRWSVIDQGSGIAESDMQRIASRHVSLAGGEGIGLSICRQLATLHFSNLVIRSRSGIGTEVSFETAASGPHSVAQSWSRWRTLLRPPRRRPEAREHDTDPQTQHALPSEIQRGMRLDPPVLSVTLSAETPPPRCEDRLTAGIVTLAAGTERVTADAFDKLVQSQLQMFELLYRVDVRRWVWMLDADIRDARQRAKAIDERCNQELKNLQTHWSSPQIIPVDEQRLAPRLSDLLIRHSLHTAGACYSDGNEVRLGTAPIQPSEVAATRLDDELRRLGARWKIQTLQIQASAEKLRLASPN